MIKLIKVIYAAGKVKKEKEVTEKPPTALMEVLIKLVINRD